MIGLVGRKCGMTRIFENDGTSVPVTVILVESNKVTQIKKLSSDGYNAVQVTTGFSKPKKINKALTGHYAKANVVPGIGLWEFKLNLLSQEEIEKVSLGDEFNVSQLKSGDLVDITGKSIGKGFAGTHKRHNYSCQNNSHGNSLSHRAPGSIGQNQTPGRVLPGKKMAGHMGNKTVTKQSLTVVKVDESNNIILVKGGVPGAVNGKLIITSALKQPRKRG